MFFELDRILKNKDCKRLELWDNEFIVYKCGFVFKKDKGRNKGEWKLLNLNKKNNGYTVVNIETNDGVRRVRLHRLVFYAFNPEWNIMDTSKNNLIDHINGIRSDNRLSNLRNITNQHNIFNTKQSKGYCYHKGTKKYRATISIDGKQKHLGMFKTKTGARLKYLRTKEILHKITEL